MLGVMHGPPMIGTFMTTHTYIVYYICCVIMSREVMVTTSSRPSRAWRCKGEVLGVVPLLCAKCSEAEAQDDWDGQVGLGVGSAWMWPHQRS